MKITLSTSQAIEILRADNSANWSYNGAEALIKWLDETDDETDDETELDVAAIRCGYSEYESLQTWAHAYFSKPQEEFDEYDFDETIRKYVKLHGVLLEFNGGVIVSIF